MIVGIKKEQLKQVDDKQTIFRQEQNRLNENKDFIFNTAFYSGPLIISVFTGTRPGQRSNLD